MKPKQKFFEAFLDNDLSDAIKFADDFKAKLLNNEIAEIPKDIRDGYFKPGGSFDGITHLDQYYNIFRTDHPILSKLHAQLKKLTQEACEYYNLDFESQNFKLQGWLNYEYGTPYGREMSPKLMGGNYHEHMGGRGAPDFHGYYCVNAEPSVTFYLIDKVTEFKNININNRAVVSETGHPHAPDNWYSREPRITIAYDIIPEISRRTGDERHIDL
jgi:hypothetical protein